MPGSLHRESGIFREKKKILNARIAPDARRAGEGGF
jgi:hypothetical protein